MESDNCKDNIQRKRESAEHELLGPGKSVVAQRLCQLKNSVARVIRDRERLPHPLFWSLFLGEVKELRRRNERKRLLQKLFFDAEV